MGSRNHSFQPENYADRVLAAHRPRRWKAPPGRAHLSDGDRNYRPFFGAFRWDIKPLPWWGPTAMVAGWAGFLVILGWLPAESGLWFTGGYAAVWTLAYVGDVWAQEHRRLSSRCSESAWNEVADVLKQRPHWRPVVASWRRPGDELRIRDARALIRAHHSVVAPRSLRERWVGMQENFGLWLVSTAAALLSPLYPLVALVVMAVRWKDAWFEKTHSGEECRATAARLACNLEELSSASSLDQALAAAPVERKVRRL